VDDPVPVGPAEDTVLLPIVNRAELEELRLEEATWLSEVVVVENSKVLVDPVPVGPTEDVVLFPMVKRAELEDIELEEAVELIVVMFVMLTAAELEELEEVKVVEADIPADAVGPVEEVVLLTGKGILLLVPMAPTVDDTPTLDPDAILSLVGDTVEVLERAIDVETVGLPAVVLSPESEAVEEEPAMEDPMMEEEDMKLDDAEVEETTEVGD
jgi:hypothetical protein